MSEVNGEYSAVADEQLDALEAAEHTAYDPILDLVELIFTDPGTAQSLSSALTTEDGIRFRTGVKGHYPMCVFWSHTDEGPRIEAVFPYDR